MEEWTIGTQSVSSVERLFLLCPLRRGEVPLYPNVGMCVHWTGYCIHWTGYYIMMHCCYLLMHISFHSWVIKIFGSDYKCRENQSCIYQSCTATDSCSATSNHTSAAVEAGHFHQLGLLYTNIFYSVAVHDRLLHNCIIITSWPNCEIR